jgi:hypothetical protein
MSTGLKQIIDAELEGKTRTYSWRKNPTQTTVSGYWFDLSMSPGNPVPQYYIGGQGVATQLKQSTDGGLFHGANVSPSVKYLRSLTVRETIATPLPMNMMLLDYLMFYSFIDEGTTDEQILVNNVSLPRFTDGAGVQVMAVSVATRTGGQQFRINYTNQNGVAGRVSKDVIQNSVIINGNIVTSNPAGNFSSGMFIPLQEGDTGVRSIQSVTMLGVDVGLFALVLVKPLAQIGLKEITTVYEKDFLALSASLPKIEDDAYLNFIVQPVGTLATGSVFGDIKVTWI